MQLCKLAKCQNYYKSLLQLTIKTKCFGVYFKYDAAILTCISIKFTATNNTLRFICNAHRSVRFYYRPCVWSNKSYSPETTLIFIQGKLAPRTLPRIIFTHQICATNSHVTFRLSKLLAQGTIYLIFCEL